MIFVSFIAVGSDEWLTVITSLLGATALIFVGKGDAIGQFLTIVFAVLYAIISYQFRYFVEMITYLGMTAPSAAIAMINWLRHPYSEREVEVNEMTEKNWIVLFMGTVLATALFGVLLRMCGTANLFFSTISVTTSFLASMLTIFRSHFYALAYAANDVILIILWVLATMENSNYIPMIICFIIFLVNDLYGYVNWQRMKKRQNK